MRYFIFLLLSLTLGLGCGQDDEDSRLPADCTEIRGDIQSQLGGASTTRVEFGDRSTFGPGVPELEGCILTFNNRSFNLNQAVYWERDDDQFIIWFN